MRAVLTFPLISTLLIGCKSKTNTKIDKNLSNQEINLFSKQTDIEGFNLKMGYKKYEKGEFSFKNPAYIVISKENKIIYTDNFGAYDELYINHLGFHNLDGRKLVLTLNFGTEACDYSQGIRYYLIDENNKVIFLKQYWAQYTDYASLSIETIFPEDKNGKNNCLKIVENLNYNESKEKALNDTSIFSFSKNRIDLIKLSDNIN